MASAPNAATVATYRQMIANARAALKREFPERHDIYIVDQSRPPQEEIARAAAQLNVPDLAERLRAQSGKKDSLVFNGVMIPLTTADNRQIHMVFGWGYSNELNRKKSSDPISASNMLGLTKVTMHELAHALYAGPYETPGQRRFNESFAELFALDVTMRNHQLPKSVGDVIASVYDQRELAADPYSERYDPGDEYATLLQQYYPKPSSYRPLSITFSNLRDSYDRTLRIARDQQIRDRQPGMVSIDNAQLLAGSLLTARGMDPLQIQEWMANRPQLFPRAATFNAAHLFEQIFTQKDAESEAQGVPMQNRQFPSYERRAPAPNSPRVAAVAWLFQAQGHDPAEQIAAKVLVRDVLRREMPKMNFLEHFFIDPQKVVNNTQCTGWAKDVVDGKPLKDTALGLAVCSVTAPWHFPSISLPFLPKPKSAEPPKRS